MNKGKVIFNSGKSDIILDVIITQEKIEDKTFFVAQGIQIDVASQGLSLEEALDNLRDAAEIALENSSDKTIIADVRNNVAPMLTRVFL